MQHFLWRLAYFFNALGVVSVVLYAPFAKTWIRALLVPFALLFAWGVIYVTTIFYFNEDSPPGMFFVATPFFAVLYAAIVRGAKLLLFKLPPLKILEEKVRFRLAAIQLRWKNHTR